MVLEKTFESPLDCKEIQLIHPKGNQSWIFIGRTEAEAPILWPPDAKSWIIGKDPDAGKDWRQDEKVTTEDKMVGWHHQLKGHEFEQIPGDGEGQRNLVCCSPWGHKQSNTTSVQFSSVTQKCPTICDPMDCSTPGFPVYHQLLEFTQTYVHWVDDAIQLSHPLSSPSPPAFNLSQPQGLFQWVSSSHQVAKVPEHWARGP